MDQGPLVISHIDAGAEFLRRFDQSFPVKIAFWLKGSEGGEWYLYIASEAIDGTNFDLGYGEVLRLTGEKPELGIDPFQVRVVSADDPVARAALDVQNRWPGKMPTRYHGPQLGGVGIEDSYIYPSPINVPDR
ncbi:MAG: hypothetical protein NVSMB9_15760 [Isosphaeraceae bacterium]